MSVPGDGGFVEVDEDLLGLEVFLHTPGAKLAAETGLFVAAPGRFDVSRLHVIDPENAGPERLHNAKRFVNVASPDGGSEAVRRVVGAANGFGFAVEGN